MEQFIMVKSELFEELLTKINSMNDSLSMIQKQINGNSKLMNQTVAAKKLGITTQTLINHVKQGLITPIYINNRPYYTDEVIDNYTKEIKP